MSDSVSFHEKEMRTHFQHILFQNNSVISISVDPWFINSEGKSHCLLKKTLLFYILKSNQ